MRRTTGLALVALVALLTLGLVVFMSRTDTAPRIISHRTSQAVVKSEVPKSANVGEEIRVAGSFRVSDPNAQSPVVLMRFVSLRPNGEEMVANEGAAIATKQPDGSFAYEVATNAPTKLGRYQARTIVVFNDGLLQADDPKTDKDEARPHPLLTIDEQPIEVVEPPKKT